MKRFLSGDPGHRNPGGTTGFPSGERHPTAGPTAGARHRPLENQNGQMIVELAMMMIFLAMVFLAVIIVSEVSTRHLYAVESLRSQMRRSMHAAAAGPFQKKEDETVIAVDVPGKMRQVFDTPFILQKMKFHYYEGSYQGQGQNVYRTLGQKVREIND